MASKKIDYNSISFKNKDVDKFLTKFGNGDPERKGNLVKNPDGTYININNPKGRDYYMESRGFVKNPDGTYSSKKNPKGREEIMAQKGFIKNPDGTYSKPKENLAKE